ncbi:MAG: hypothetical protein ABDH49_00525 [Candidatus Hydrothermales bacterium]
MFLSLFIFLFFLETQEADFFTGNPLFVLNPLFVPFFYTDSINDFSPNYLYKNLYQKFIERDSQRVITRFTLFRSAFNTEQNNISSFFPLFRDKLKTLIFISVHKNKLSYNFAKHNYYFFLSLEPFPVNFECSLFDANPFNKFVKIEKFEFSLRPLLFSIFYSQENGKKRKTKYGIGFSNSINNFLYSITLKNYRFYLANNKRSLRNLKIETSFFSNFTVFEIGAEREKKRYIFESGLKFKPFKFSYFKEKLLFPIYFDSLTDYFDYNEDIKREGLRLNFSLKYEKNDIEVSFEYFNCKNLFYLNYPFRAPKLLSGNFFSIFTCDSVNFFNFFNLFAKFKIIKGKNFYKEIYSVAFKFFILKNVEKSYFLYLIANFDYYDKNSFLKVSIKGKFYSSLFISFSYSNPLKGNYFYYEHYPPSPFYSVRVSANIYD